VSLTDDTDLAATFQSHERWMREAVAEAQLAAEAGEADWRLDGATLYVTLEPCTMCCGAILLARLQSVVFGASDPRAGAVVSTARLLVGNPYRQSVEIVGGILAEPCSALLTHFFAKRRSS